MTSAPLAPANPDPAPPWYSPKFWRSWAWLAALIGGFIPVVLPDILNWALSHADLLIDLAFPTMTPETKVVVLKVVVTAVLVLRAMPQKNMTPAALAPAPAPEPHFPDTQSPGEYALELERMGELMSPETRRRIEEAAAEQVFRRHARSMTGEHETPR